MQRGSRAQCSAVRRVATWTFLCDGGRRWYSGCVCRFGKERHWHARTYPGMHVLYDRRAVLASRRRLITFYVQHKLPRLKVKLLAGDGLEEAPGPSGVQHGAAAVIALFSGQPHRCGCIC